MKKILFVICLALLLVGCKMSSNDYITEFNYSYGGGWSIIHTYEIKQDGDKYIYTYNETNSSAVSITKELTKEDIKKLGEVIEKNEIDSWDGFNSSSSDIMDGTFFSIDVKYNSGKVIKAYGYMDAPKNHQKGEDALVEFFEKYNK